jgi:two-component system sensor histidine kinase KdpD
VAGLRFARDANVTAKEKQLNSHLDQIAMALHRRRVREISERAKITAESERLSKTLLDAVAHEVRTPLAAIQAAAGNLIQFGERNLSSQQSSMVGEIQEASARLNRLIGKIMDVTRLECGDVKPKFDLREPGDLLRAAACETRAELRCHRLTLEIAPDLPLAPMDYQLMLHALTNLLSNAARHTPENTQVRLIGRREADHLILEVEDDGPGIPPELLGSLFHKFSRAPRASPGGVGLGLSLVKGFVEAQGGEVTAANRPSGGAVFSIQMPLATSSGGA